LAPVNSGVFFQASWGGLNKDGDQMRLYALDYESEAIQTRPDYPPKPVGLAIYPEDGEATYMAWGHPVENNCTENNAVDVLVDLFRVPENEFVFHNAPFDCSIIEERFMLNVPWDRIHDTMLQAFLLDPYGELSLKPLAHTHLDMPPEEQDAVRQWLVSKGICRAAAKDWGAYIARAPGKLVGEYAKGDVIRTLKLFRVFEKKLQARNMA
jgi:hypothetical protein